MTLLNTPLVSSNSSCSLIKHAKLYENIFCLSQYLQIYLLYYQYNSDYINNKWSVVKLRDITGKL